MSPRRPKLMPDAVYPGMWRVRWPDGRLSDMTNLARAKDAIACFIETEERRLREQRQSRSEARLRSQNETLRTSQRANTSATLGSS
jgi:hypothetical protein